MNYRICIHGGAGALSPENYTPEEVQSYTNALQQALNKGLEDLRKGKSALDAVVSAVISLEDCPLFNAGIGSVFSDNATIEMDASVMDGRSGQCGGVSNVRTIKNPILAAREVMLKTPHSIICSHGADELAAKAGLEIKNNDYFKTQKRLDQLQQAKMKNSIQLDHGNETGTVGAVAIDSKGNLAAATSTGGMTNKIHGRVSDSSIVGAGTWAQNGICAFSGTGNGDIFIQNASARDFAALMEYKNFTLAQAAKKILDDIDKAGGSGGLIAIDKNGNYTMPFNSSGMFRAMGDSSGSCIVEIFKT